MINAVIESVIDFLSGGGPTTPGAKRAYLYRRLGKLMLKDSTGLETAYQSELNSTTDVTVKTITVTDSILTPNLHNNATALNNNQKIVSGTYTPTLTTFSNIGAGTLLLPVGSSFMFTRIGNVVQVSGKVSLTTSATNTLTRFIISLPIPPTSNFIRVDQAIGSGVSKFPNTNNQTRQGMTIEASVGTLGVLASFFSASATNMSYNITFSYTI